MAIYSLQIIAIVIVLLTWITTIYLSVKGKKILWDLVAQALIITMLAYRCFFTN